MSDAEWPRLEVGKQDWERIFGKGYNNKLYLWFAVPGIWRATEHQFWPEIILWNKQHGNAWAVVQSKITAWIKQLRKLGFSHFVEGRGIDQEKFDIMKSGLPERARRIVAYSERAAIGEQQIEKLSQADLVNVLYDTIVKQCAIIDGLT